MKYLYKLVLLIMIAIISGTLMYMVTPVSWSEGKYTAEIVFKIDNNTYRALVPFYIGKSSEEIYYTEVIDGNKLSVAVNISSLKTLAPGTILYVRAKFLDNNKTILPGIANIKCDIVLPDGRTYEYYASSVDSDTGIYTFKIQPYVKAREAGFVFGSAIVLFAGASVLHYVVTGLYSTIALVILGVIGSKDPFQYYMSNIVLIFIAGSGLELIIKENGLDERVARLLLRLSRSPYTLIISSTFLVSFLSMWTSNTAATYVMLPLILVILNKVGLTDMKYSSILLVSLAVAASVGGTATLIGTPPNIIAAGFLNDLIYGGMEYIDFTRWLYIGFPAWAIGYGIAVILAILYAKLVAGHEFDRIRDALGKVKTSEARKWSKRELLAMANILFLIGLWMTGRIHGLSTGLASVIGLLAFFATRALDVQRHWKRLAWDLMVLFGAGLTLGKALMATGWANYILSQLSGIRELGYIALFIIAFTAYIVGTFISSHTSASAFVAPLTIPLGMLLATSLGLPVETGAAVATIAAVVSLNNAVALPISSPPSAIVYATGRVRMRDLVLYGFLYGLIANTLIVTLLIPYWIHMLTP